MDVRIGQLHLAQTSQTRQTEKPDLFLLQKVPISDRSNRADWVGVEREWQLPVPINRHRYIYSVRLCGGVKK